MNGNFYKQLILLVFLNSSGGSGEFAYILQAATWFASPALRIYNFD
jgi:hypothetical protein